MEERTDPPTTPASEDVEVNIQTTEPVAEQKPEQSAPGKKKVKTKPDKYHAALKGKMASAGMPTTVNQSFANAHKVSLDKRERSRLRAVFLSLS